MLLLEHSCSLPLALLTADSGTTARLLAKWRPMCPVLSVTRTPHVARVVRP